VCRKRFDSYILIALVYVATGIWLAAFLRCYSELVLKRECVQSKRF